MKRKIPASSECSATEDGQKKVVLEFINQDTHADIKMFTMVKEQDSKWKLILDCNEQGKEKIISRFGTDSLVEKFLNFFCSIEKKYIITNAFVAENTILAINYFYYILQE